MAHKLVYYVVAHRALCPGVLSCRGFFSGWPDPATMGAFVLSLVLSFLLGFFLEATLGMVGFWILEVSSLLFVYQLFSFFFSGQMFPIDILPGVARQFVDLLPIPYMAYFPVAVFLGKITGMTWPWGLAVQVGWVVFFLFASRLVLHLGLKLQRIWGLGVTVREIPSFWRVFLFARNSLIRDMTSARISHRFLSSLAGCRFSWGFTPDLRYTPTIGLGGLGKIRVPDFSGHYADDQRPGRRFFMTNLTNSAN